MKILLYGAGVIGSIYAAKLHEAGCDITLLARGKRFENLRQHHVIIRDAVSGKQTISDVPLTQELAPTDYYDLIIVTVRLDQVGTVIPVLENNSVCPLIMLMLNNPDGIEHLTKKLEPKHIILGFPGVGGTCRDNFIEYIQIKQQKTTVGELNGKTSIFMNELKVVFEGAKLKVIISTDMQSWLKTHAVFVACVAAAISKENGDIVQLGKKRASVVMMVRAIREGFSACKALGMPIAPTNLKIIFMIMPLWFCVLYWQVALKGKVGTLGIAPHANAAKDEMQLLAKKVMAMVYSSPTPTPILDRLLLSFGD